MTYFLAVKVVSLGKSIRCAGRVIVSDETKATVHSGLSVNHQIAIGDTAELREVLLELRVVHTLRNLADEKLVLSNDASNFRTGNGTFGINLRGEMR